MKPNAKIIQRVCVYCASSSQAHSAYLDAARTLGRELAAQRISIVYGGGSLGCMGQLADGALASGGKVVGVIPQFMYDLEWAHRRVTELRVVPDLHERKRLMAEGADAIVALPGGSGTLEELLEAITWKRLGLYLNPIVLVNIRGFFDPCLELLERCISERFMHERHREMWSTVETPEDVIDAIRRAPVWYSDARKFAAL